MKLLGIGGSGHSFSTCIFDEGIKVAIEEERLNKIKHCLVPNTSVEVARARAIKYCLGSTGIGIGDLDLILADDFINPLYLTRLGSQEVVKVNHHLAHACSAYYTSPFDEAAVLVADGCGSRAGTDSEGFPLHETTTLYYAKGSEIRELHKVRGRMPPGSHFPTDSIGEWYSSITQALGYEFLDDGITMGLSAYGTDRFVGKLQGFYQFDESGTLLRTVKQRADMNQFMYDQLREARGEARFQVAADLAYAGQIGLERMLITACRALYDSARTPNLCMAGGVMFNCAAVAKIRRETPFQNIYVFPAAGDAGTSIGCALYGHHILGKHGKENARFSPYLGHPYRREDCLSAVDACRAYLVVEERADLYERVAEFLACGAVVAMFQGRSEFGPRALGNRSILADPRSAAMRDRMNARVKRRRPFQPLAPIVLGEYQAEWFESSRPSLYMTELMHSRLQARERIQAAIHVDGTSRVQTVSDHNHHLYDLLLSFYRLTGTPALLNTSFNPHGFPMVESPDDAVRAFLDMELDVLVMGGMLIRKSEIARKGGS